MQKKTLRLTLFGGILTQIDDAPPLQFSSLRAEVLLAYLAEKGMPISRDVLANLLWDDRPRKRGLSNLRSLLAQLPDTAKPFLVTNRRTVGLNLEYVSTDVANFEKLLRKQGDLEALEKGVQLYKGGFLDGVYLSDSRSLNEWILFNRERFWVQAADIYFQLSEHSFYLRHYRLSAKYIQKLLHMDSLREDAHRLAMRLYARDGKLGAALAQYEKCRQVLANELSISPSIQTEQLRQRLEEAQKKSPFQPPLQSTPFIGRQAEIAELTAALDSPENRLITLLGQGGTGKTRLSIEIANTVQHDFINGVHFIPLASISHISALPVAIGSLLGIEFQGTRSAEIQLFQYLEHKEILLILDNVEQLLPQFSLFAQKLLENAKHLQLIITSRERLLLPYEFVFQVGGLAYQPDKGPNEAHQLFTAIAHKGNQRFELTENNRAFITRICETLQGLPLGIEFIASWTHILPIEELSNEIEKGFDLLTSREKRAERHASLLVVFDYSWQRLSDQEQTSLLKLSLFRGGVSRHAAQKVAGTPIQILGSLIDKSMVYQITDKTRYGILLVFRRYIDEQWKDETMLQNTRQAYVTYFSSWLAEQLGGHWISLPEGILKVIGAEIENLRQAWRIQLEDSNPCPKSLSAFINGFYLYYQALGLYEQGSDLFSQVQIYLSHHARTSPAQFSHLLAQAFSRHSSFSLHLRDIESAQSQIAQGLNIFYKIEDPWEISFLYRQLSSLHYYENSHSMALKYAEDSEKVSALSNDPAGQANALRLKGMIHGAIGEYEVAGKFLKSSLDIHRGLGYIYLETQSLNRLANNLCELGEYQQALVYYHECLDLYRTLGSRYHTSLTLNNIATVHIVEGRFQQVVPMLTECRQICEEIGDRQGVGVALLNLGYSAYKSGNLERAQPFLKESIDICRDTGYEYMELLGMLFSGYVLQGHGEWKQAFTVFQEVIRRSNSADLKPFVLRSLVGIAVILHNNDATSRGLQILKFICAHESSNLETRKEAMAALDMIKGELKDDEDSIKWAESEPLNFESLIREVSSSFGAVSKSVEAKG